ncbi:MAG TPA: hypothetical protein VGB51_09100 [Actinomycetota bacterium]
MRCDAAERELSGRLDGAAVDASVDAHLETCPACRTFLDRARRIREVARLEPAAAVPDLVPAIMERVAAEPRPGWIAPGWRRPAASFAAAALAAAVLAGALPGIRGPSARAGDLPRLVAEAAPGVTAYDGAFTVLERNFHADVPIRRFDLSIAFRAPERLSIELRDRTAYPSEAWLDGDLRLAVDRDRWSLTAPRTCPRQSLPACPGTAETTAVRGREPFDGDAPLPTDIILPLQTLAASGAARVIGETTLLGRPVVTVALPFRDASPLFAFQAGGSWRPFFPQDAVHVSLDRETWFPLEMRVFPSAAAERDRWALAHGLPPEPPGREILRVTAGSFRVGSSAAAPTGPAATAGARDEGFREVEPGAIAEVAGAPPVLPAQLLDLRPYRFGTFSGGGRPDGEVLLSYSRGLSWLKIRETRSWDEPSPFGEVGPLAAPLELPGGGFAHYEPATASLGRRLSIHARGWDLYVESNLPMEELLAVAASLPVRGLPTPAEWLVRRWPGGSLETQVPLERAVRLVPGLVLPASLPAGYRRWTIQLLRTGDAVAATVYFRREDIELGGAGVRLHQAPGEGLAPPMDPDVLAVRVRGVTGRYAVSRGELEWVEGGVYRSLRGDGLDLAGLLAIASSLRPPQVHR